MGVEGLAGNWWIWKTRKSRALKNPGQRQHIFFSIVYPPLLNCFWSSIPIGVSMATMGENVNDMFKLARNQAFGQDWVLVWTSGWTSRDSQRAHVIFLEILIFSMSNFISNPSVSHINRFTWQCPEERTILTFKWEELITTGFTLVKTRVPVCVWTDKLWNLFSALLPQCFLLLH